MPLAAHSTAWNADFGTYSSVAPLRLALVSDFCRTPFRANSDTIPMGPKNCPTSVRNTVRYESERCPAQIGMLSDRNWNQCPTAPGIRNPKAECRSPKEGRNPRAEWVGGGLGMHKGMLWSRLRNGTVARPWGDWGRCAANGKWLMALVKLNRFEFSGRCLSLDTMGAGRPGKANGSL